MKIGLIDLDSHHYPNLALMKISAYHKAQGDSVEWWWIPYSDPPKEKGCYFVTVKHWYDGNPVVREAYWNGAEWLSCERKQEITPRVTHWMPMPEPAKENDYAFKCKVQKLQQLSK